MLTIPIDSRRRGDSVQGLIRYGADITGVVRVWPLTDVNLVGSEACEFTLTNPSRVAPYPARPD